VPGAWLVLPTYDEAGTLEPLVRAVLPQLALASSVHRVLVVDDNSPDGTGRVADRLAAELDGVEVIHRAFKAGLGPAYIDGFRRALGAGAELVLQMDADFSHDPADVPRLIAAAAGSDVVLGSRYAPGGGIENWGLGRRLLSRAGCRYARSVLGVGVRDLTGGFKCMRAEVLRELDLSTIRADGYGFQIEVTYRALKSGFSVAELPIVFHERRTGRSKMSLPIALEAVWRVPALRRHARSLEPPEPLAER
jgi:dolichol-phosphate mannosyltransferase